MAHWVKNPIAVAWVTVEACVQSLARKLPYAVGTAIKKKKKKKRKERKKRAPVISYDSRKNPVSLCFLWKKYSKHNEIKSGFKL